MNSEQNDMPGLRTLSEELPCGDLTKTAFICCQHLLPTQVTLFDSFLKQGLKPENCHLLGKCYSTHPETYEYFSSLGMRVDKNSKTYNSHRGFDAQYKDYVETFFTKAIRQIKLKELEKVVCLDDGGMLLGVVLQYVKDYPRLHDHIVTVEQTSSGYNKLAKEKFKFPVVNVARSEAKLIGESPYIAELVLDKTTEILTELNRPMPTNALVIGGGPIGSNICTLLHRYNIPCHVYDRDSKLSTLSHKQFNNTLDEYDLIIGSTGIQSLNQKQIDALHKQVVLTSASSSDREFDILHLRHQQERVADPYHHIEADDKLVMSQGFPINFYKHAHMSVARAELTRCLMYAGAQQGLNIQDSKQKGFIKLNEKTQGLIHEILQH